jgi:hypothetical protein
MIECIFTIDYEIYGNGKGSLKELIYKPAEELIKLFLKWNSRFVAFIEVGELEKIEAEATDPSIEIIKEQIRDLYKEGFELGLHLHPQWYNARYEEGQWRLDQSEYNLCRLPRERIEEIIKRSLAYFRRIVDEPDFTPLSFRAGNWLLQPTGTAAAILAEAGVKIDSSVFKGGLQRNHRMDYRPALRNGPFWRFSDDVNTSDPAGFLIEMPIYTRMVPFWKLLTMKRVGLERRSPDANYSRMGKLIRLMDFARFRYPLKLDFCRMTIEELTDMMDAVIRKDEKDPTSCKPIVAIGHTKDCIDYRTVDFFLRFLKERNIAVSTFQEVYTKHWQHRTV